MFLNLDGKGDYRDEDGGSVQGSGPGGTLTFYLANSENFEQKVEYKEEKKLSPSILQILRILNKRWNTKRNATPSLRSNVTRHRLSRPSPFFSDLKLVFRIHSHSSFDE